MRELPRVGYAAFTMASVRDTLGLSNGSVFHAFPSKAALAAAVYVERRRPRRQETHEFPMPQ
jgi:AcrR family transcriptional regulator